MARSEIDRAPTTRFHSIDGSLLISSRDRDFATHTTGVEVPFELAIALGTIGRRCLLAEGFGVAIRRFENGPSFATLAMGIPSTDMGVYHGCTAPDLRVLAEALLRTADKLDAETDA